MMVSTTHPEAVRNVLIGALASGRSDLLDGSERVRGGELDVVDEILERLEREAVAQGGAGELAVWLAGLAPKEGARRSDLGDAIGLAARRIAPAGSEAPSTGPEGEAWQALVTAVDLLYGGGATPVGPLPFVGPSRLADLVSESDQQLPERPESGERISAVAGPVLANLAVSRQLREAASAAFGLAVKSNFRAQYMYDPPGSHIHTHVDARSYELVFHLVLTHEVPDRSEGSALVVHLAGEPVPTRLHVKPGESVALCGRGTIHSWEPLGEGERRTLTAIGFERAA